jgi:hypothetical protein
MPNFVGRCMSVLAVAIVGVTYGCTSSSAPSLTSLSGTWFADNCSGQASTPCLHLVLSDSAGVVTGTGAMTNVLDFVLSGTYVPPNVTFATRLTIPTPVGVAGEGTLTGTVSGDKMTLRSSPTSAPLVFVRR